MANQGGSHDQHVKAGEQSHKNAGASSSSSRDEKSNTKSDTNPRGGSHEQHVKAGQQSHKNSN